MKPQTLQKKITLISIILIAISTFGLTLTLNFSAAKMADTIEAVPITPAIGPGNLPLAPIEMSDTSKHARNTYLLSSIIYSFVFTISGGLLTYYITGKTLKPLTDLSDQMRNVTIDNLSKNLTTPKGNDEVSHLTKAFNTMSSSLDQSFEMQKRFTESAAHELRTPLAIQRTKIDVFKIKDRTQDEYNELIDTLSNSSNRLNDIVTTLLTLSNTQDIQLNESVNIDTLITEIIKNLEPLAQSKNINIELISNEAKTIKGNYTLLLRAYYNIVENAIKYSPEDNAVTVHINNDNISIADNGIGIDDTYKPHIFEPFYRADKSRNRKYAGSGLGLCITKSIIDKHNFKIEILDNEPQGIIFVVSI